jgi:tetratricopeptide (TPR) repeat protein
MPVRRLVSWLVVALVVAAFAAPTVAGDDDNKGDEEEIDYVALAARLVRDGHFDRAEITLNQVDENDEDVDKKLFYVLRGLVSLQKKLYVAAADSFDKAVRAGNRDPLVFINLARARFGSKDYAGAVKALERAGPAVREQVGAELLGSRAYWELGKPGPALEILHRAQKRFPSELELARMEIYYLLELELFQELARRHRSFLRRTDIEAKDLAAMAEALRRSGQLEQAKKSLEAARLRFPGDVTLTVMLARTYMDTGAFLSSAILLEEAARSDRSYLVEAAEMYRRAGRLVRALFLNKRIVDQKAKMRQRLQILLELEQFEQISAMEARLSRLGLLADEQIRYALAYGFFQIRDFASAERHLRALRDPALFAKGIELRRAIESCTSAGWLCN